MMTNHTNHNASPTAASFANIGLSIVSIWHSISSCSLGTSLLLERQETLPILTELLGGKRRNNKLLPTSNSMQSRIVLEGLGVFKNLTYYGEDHRYLIVQNAELMSTLTSLTVGGGTIFVGNNNDDGKSMERLSAVLRNLALSSDVRGVMARRSNVLTCLIKLASSGGGAYNNNAHRNVLRNITSTLSSLAMDGSSINLLLFHGDGMLVKQLQHCLSTSDDAVVCKRAARTVRLLAREEASPAASLLHDPDLLSILSERAMHDANDGVRTECQEAFARCAGLVRAPMEQYGAVLDALSNMALNSTYTGTLVDNSNNHVTVSTGVSADIVTRALREQAQHSENRVVMVQRKELVEGLANILSSPQASGLAKDNVCHTLLDLSKESSNHAAMASSPAILGSIVNFLMERPAANESLTWTRMREDIIRVVLNLAHTPSTREMLASQTSMIQSLLQFASATSTNHDLKKKVKTAILQLASAL
ncbi:MAG: hypothetical protein SGILL_009198 [Bacillariaceae sp.]